MKFKIKEKQGEKEPVVELWLEEGGYDNIPVLMVQEKGGNVWRLMEFYDGKFRRCEFVKCVKGIETDEKGRIVEDE